MSAQLASSRLASSTPVTVAPSVAPVGVIVSVISLSCVSGAQSISIVILWLTKLYTGWYSPASSPTSCGSSVNSVALTISLWQRVATLFRFLSLLMVAKLGTCQNPYLCGSAILGML